MELITKDIFYKLSGRNIVWKKQYYSRLDFMTKKSKLHILYLYWPERKIPLVCISDLGVILYSSQFDIPYQDPDFLSSIKSLTVDSWIIDLLEKRDSGFSYSRNEFTRYGELLESAGKMFSSGVYYLRNSLDPDWEERFEIFKEDLYQINTYSSYLCCDLCKDWITDHDNAVYGLALRNLILNTKSLNLCQTNQNQ